MTIQQLQRRIVASFTFISLFYFSCSLPLSLTKHKQNENWTLGQNKHKCKLLIKIYRVSGREHNLSTVYDVSRWLKKENKQSLVSHFKNMKCPANTDLRRIFAQNMDLQNIYLKGALIGPGKFDGSILKKANLSYSNLYRTSFKKADLRQATLQKSYMVKSLLQGANLQRANLQSADLRFARMENTNLQNADLRFSLLSHAYLMHADLRRADLRGAILFDQFGTPGLKNARFDNAKLAKAFLSIWSISELHHAQANLSYSVCLEHKFPRTKSLAWRCYLWHKKLQRQAKLPIGCPKTLRGPIIAYQERKHAFILKEKYSKIKQRFCP